jgi:hypothetical protein
VQSRRIAVAVVVALGLGASSVSAKPKKKGPGPYGPSSRVVRPAQAHGQASLRVRSIDFAKRIVVVEVGGFPQAPAGNLFTFSDDRGRKFIATNAQCEAPFPSGVRVCDLMTPEGYERHPWIGLELHLHGLTSTTVAAPREEVERAYEAARAALGEAPPAMKTEPEEKTAPSPSPAPPDNEEEEEKEEE